VGEAAEGVPHVLQRRLDERQAAAVAVRLLHLLHAAELEHRAAPRLRRVEAGADAVVGGDLEMALQLVRDLAVAPAPPEEPGRADGQRAQRLHDRTFTNRATIAAAWFQACSSRSASRLPTRVSV
jgi:hypothetical protein